MLVSEPQLSAAAFEFVDLDLGRSTYGSLHPDAWPPVAITDPRQTKAKMMAVAGDKYTYAELEKFTDLIQRTLNGLPEVSKSARTGVLPQAVTLVYSDQRLASYGLQPSKLSDLLVARNITRTAGMINAGGVSCDNSPKRRIHQGCANRQYHSRDLAIGLARLSPRPGDDHA